MWPFEFHYLERQAKYFILFLFFPLSTPPRALEINAQWATVVIYSSWYKEVNLLYIINNVQIYYFYPCKSSCSSLAMSQCWVQGSDFRTTFLEHELSPFIHSLQAVMVALQKQGKFWTSAWDRVEPASSWDSWLCTFKDPFSGCPIMLFWGWELIQPVFPFDL